MKSHRIASDPTLRYDDSTLLTQGEAWTWAALPAVPFAFRTAAERRDAGWVATLSLAALREGDARITTVHHPTDPAASAAARHAHAVATGRPGANWAEYLSLEQEAAWAAESSRKQSYLGFRLGRRSPHSQAASLAWRRRTPFDPVTGAEAAAWAQRAAALRQVLGAGGFRARGLDAAGLRALRGHCAWRSTGTPPPSSTGRNVWTGLAVADEFTDVGYTPQLGCLRVDTPAGSAYHATFALAAFPASMDFPNVDPWLAHLDRLEFPVESDLVLSLVTPGKAERHVRGKLRLAQDQRRDAARADAELPIETQEMLTLAQEMQYAIPRRRMPLAYGWARVRVDGASPAEIREKYEVLRAHMGSVGPGGIDVAWPRGQAQEALYLEGIPGYPTALRSWRQRWMVETVGCALPQAASSLGDESSALRGRTTGRQRRAVRWSPHNGIRFRHPSTGAPAPRPGGTVLLGNQGAGKSSALGMIVFDETMQAHPTVVLDPSGPLARLGEHPWLSGRVRVFNLTTAENGVVDPLGPHVIPLYPPAADESSTDYERRRARAYAARERLARHTFHLLVWRQYAARPDAETAVLRAIHEEAWSPRPSLRGAVRALLEAEDPNARWIGEHLSYEAENPDVSMAFGVGPVSAPRPEATTTIITMPGITLPMPGKSMAEWMPAEQAGAAMMTLAASFAWRLLWEVPGDGTLAVDEAHVPLATDEGRRVISLALRDGRKRDKAVVLATHNAADVADPRLNNAFSTKLLFRSDSAGELAAALPAAGVADTEGNRRAVRSLNNGECIATFPDDVRDRFQWDRAWVPGLAALLATDSDASDARTLEAADASI